MTNHPHLVGGGGNNPGGIVGGGGGGGGGSRYSSPTPSINTASSPPPRRRLFLVLSATAAAVLAYLALHRRSGDGVHDGSRGGGGGGSRSGSAMVGGIPSLSSMSSVLSSSTSDALGGGGGAPFRPSLSFRYESGDDALPSSAAEATAKAKKTAAVTVTVFQAFPSHWSPTEHRREVERHGSLLRTGGSGDDLPLFADASKTGGGTAYKVNHVAPAPKQRRSYLQRRGRDCSSFLPPSGNNKKNHNAALERYDDFLSAGQPHLAAEVWKYCSLYNLNDGGPAALLDGETVLFATFDDAFLLPSTAKKGGGDGAPRNVAVLGSTFEGTMHGSALVFVDADARRSVSRGMLELLLAKGEGGGEEGGAIIVERLSRDPLAVPKRLYDLVAQDIFGGTGGGVDAKRTKDGTLASPLEPGNYDRNENNGRGGGVGGGWTLLRQRCLVGPDLVRPSGSATEASRTRAFFDVEEDGASSSAAAEEEGPRLAHPCRSRTGYCCEASDPSSRAVVLWTRHPLLPYQVLPPTSSLPQPYALHHASGANGGGKSSTDANVVDEDDLPYIATIREESFVKPKDHPATPNLFDTLLSMDCLPSGKECSDCLRNKKGATCETCRKPCSCFCKNLCKKEVEEKFVSKRIHVNPPMFRRDPSRLIPRIVHQTWFEDVDAEKYPNMSRLIESWKHSGWEYRFYTDADAAKFLSTHFPPEVKEAYDAVQPGAFKADLFRYCALLVNGGVYADMDVLLESNLDAAVSGDVGFMTPMDEPGKQPGKRMCLWNGFIAAAPGHPYLARAVENVVNNIRNRFTSVDVDNMLCPDPELSVSHAYDTLFTAGPCILGLSVNRVLGRHPQTQFDAGDIGVSIDSQRKGGSYPASFNPKQQIPGRTIILNQNKWDMGAHRFTWLEKNLVVAATDMPDYDDRGASEHYSKTHVRNGIYGLEKLYVDRKSADENIRVVIENR